MKIYLQVLLPVLLFSCKTQVGTNEIDFTTFVDPFIGTDGTGHTFPGPCLPFGMVQPGPDNTDLGWDYTSGYQLRDSLIMGFSQTRASGTGIGEFGDILLLPYQGRMPERLKSKKSEEIATVGYYKVRLDDEVNVELTCTERVAMHRYTYSSSDSFVHLNLQHGIRFLTDSLILDSEVMIDQDAGTISGFAHTSNWVERKYFYHIEFDHPIKQLSELPKGPKEKAPKFNLRFELTSNVLQVKIGMSSVSTDGAKRNLQAELAHWDFDQVREQAKRVWNSYLTKVEIEASEKQKEIFYTSMYHLFIHPSNIADVDGKYRGVDDEIAEAPNGEYYSTLSLWDTYRAVHPLFTLLVPERIPGFVNTMIEHHKAQGFLPIWTAWGQENYCMIGNHAIPVISDAIMKKFNGFSYEDAFNAMIQSTQENHLNSNWSLYNKYGYYPFDLLDNEAVSRTLEHGFDDYSVAITAKNLGKDSLAGHYFNRATYYKNLFDPETKLMRGKDTKGRFRTPFEPLIPTSPMNNPGDYTEANAWQYSWASTQHDVDGLIALLGGRSAFTKHLNEFFTIAGDGDNKHLGQEALIGQYAHGNEPSHHIAYLYAYSEDQRKGLELITRIYNEFYDNTPEGITGNDDCGQMSAWYIFTTLGFYPVNPANGTFVFGQPQVNSAKVKLSENLALEIRNERLTNSSSPIVLFNGKTQGASIDYLDMINGGVLVFN